MVAKGTRLQSSGDDVGGGGNGGTSSGSGSAIDPDGLRMPAMIRPALAASPPALSGVPSPVEAYMPVIPGVDGTAADIGPDGKLKSRKLVNRIQLSPPPPASDNEGRRAHAVSRIRSGGTMNPDGLGE